MAMKTNVVLIGFMGVGKSITGKLLAQKLGYQFIDTDKAVERKYQKKIKDIFAQYGEKKFRAMETEVIRELANKSSMVISTGGGVATIKENMEILRQSSVVISLMASAQTIFKRTNNEKRPLLMADTPELRMAKIQELLNSRLHYYQQADLILATDFTNPLQNAEEIHRYVRKKARRRKRK